jgi:hypothetical protein
MAGADVDGNAEPDRRADETLGAARQGSAGAVGWTSTVMACAVAGLLLFNAQSMRAWTATLAPGPLSLEARSAAETWWRTTARLGLAAPRIAIADLWAAAKAARWPAKTREGSAGQR